MDDLLDLDFTKPGPASSNQAKFGSGRSAFDYLAKPTTQPTPRVQVPLSMTASTRSPSPLQPRSNGTTGGGDAFSSLFGNTSNGSDPTSTTNGTLSMAERLAKERNASPSFGYNPSTASRSSSPALQPTRNTSSPSPSLSRPTQTFTPPLRSNAPSPANLRQPPLASSTPPLSKKPSDPWDFDLLSSTVPQSKPTTKASDPFDLGFDSPLPLTSSTSSFTTTSKASPSTQLEDDEFDLLGAFSQPARPPRSSSASSAPPPSRPDPSSSRNVNPGISPPPELLLKLTTELGFTLPEANQALIETFEKTGKFQLQDAVEILMTYPNNNDGEGTGTEILGGGGRGGGSDWKKKKKGKKEREVDEWGDEEDVRVGRRRSWEFEDNHDDGQRELARIEAEKVRRRRAQQEVESGAETKYQKTKSNGTTLHSTKPEGEAGVGGGGGGGGGGGDLDQTAKVLQEQASEVLAQAQKIGFSMFKSANAYWASGKEALAKKLEEQRKAARVAAGLPGGSSTAGSNGNGEVATNGRPKWWKEGMELDDDEDKARNAAKETGRRRDAEGPSGFKDSDDEGEGPESVLPQRPPSAKPPTQAAAPEEYRSPFRRAKAATGQATPPQPPPVVEADLLSHARQPPRPSPSTSAPTPRHTRPSPPQSPRPAAIPRRPTVPISPSALSSAISHKSTGNDHFKLGRFADASSSYSLALESLPAGSIARIVLLNNRAQSRLKSGEEKLAIEDCTEVIRILLEPCQGKIELSSLEQESLGREIKELAGGTIDLKDQFGKSLGRRAKGYEVTEKWNLGLKDWEQIRNLGDEVVVRGAGGNKLVADGIARCRKMLGPPSSGPSSSPSTSATTNQRPPTRPKPKPVSRSKVEGSGEAVKALQASQAAQTAEDDLRLGLKDQVDNRIIAWRASKETNLRALIASLDNVLWPELGWKKVGMNELITESQLKVRYVRAIAKVHPDKLNPGNTTVEQRMIAGAVFAALNEAWSAHKA